MKRTASRLREAERAQAELIASGHADIGVTLDIEMLRWVTIGASRLSVLTLLHAPPQSTWEWDGVDRSGREFGQQLRWLGLEWTLQFEFDASDSLVELSLYEGRGLASWHQLRGFLDRIKNAVPVPFPSMSDTDESVSEWSAPKQLPAHFGVSPEQVEDINVRALEAAWGWDRSRRCRSCRRIQFAPKVWIDLSQDPMGTSFKLRSAK